MLAIPIKKHRFGGDLGGEGDLNVIIMIIIFIIVVVVVVTSLHSTNLIEEVVFCLYVLYLSLIHI